MCRFDLDYPEEEGSYKDAGGQQRLFEIEMNDFERAIALSLDPYTSHENRQQATNYLNALQHSDQSWELALTVLQTSKQENVAFAAWNLLCSLVENEYVQAMMVYMTFLLVGV